MSIQRPSRSAFAGMRAFSETGFVAFDGIAQTMIVWSKVRLITAQMGRQQYDMTRCLGIEHGRGRSIFLPETEDAWAPFLAAMTKHLPGALPVEEWGPRLLEQPETTILAYRRPGLLRRLSWRLTN